MTSLANPISDSSTIVRRLVTLGVLLIFLVGPAFGPIPRYLAATMDLESATGWQIAAFLLPLVVIFYIVLRYLRRDAENLGHVGWRRPTTWLALVLGALLGLVWGAFGVLGFLQFVPEANPMELSLFRLGTALITALAAPMEDIVVRGYVMESVRKLRVGGFLQLVVSSVLFAAYHSLWAFNLIGFVFSLIYGLLLGGLFLLGRRSLTPVVLGHSLALLVGEPFLTMGLLLSA
jgi:membrane protease YdiL (CAAX protease family)